VMIVATRKRKIAQKIRLIRNCVMSSFLPPASWGSGDALGGARRRLPGTASGDVRYC
jgi:hypothetical protein